MDPTARRADLSRAAQTAPRRRRSHRHRSRRLRQDRRPPPPRRRARGRTAQRRGDPPAAPHQAVRRHRFGPHPHRRPRYRGGARAAEPGGRDAGAVAAVAHVRYRARTVDRRCDHAGRRVAASWPVRGRPVQRRGPTRPEPGAPHEPPPGRPDPHAVDRADHRGAPTAQQGHLLLPRAERDRVPRHGPLFGEPRPRARGRPHPDQVGPQSVAGHPGALRSLFPVDRRGHHQGHRRQHHRRDLPAPHRRADRCGPHRLGTPPVGTPMRGVLGGCTLARRDESAGHPSSRRRYPQRGPDARADARRPRVELPCDLRRRTITPTRNARAHPRGLVAHRRGARCSRRRR